LKINEKDTGKSINSFFDKADVEVEDIEKK